MLNWKAGNSTSPSLRNNLKHRFPLKGARANLCKHFRNYTKSHTHTHRERGRAESWKSPQLSLYYTHTQANLTSGCSAMSLESSLDPAIGRTDYGMALSLRFWRIKVKDGGIGLSGWHEGCGCNNCGVTTTFTYFRTVANQPVAAGAVIINRLGTPRWMSTTSLLLIHQQSLYVMFVNKKQWWQKFRTYQYLPEFSFSHRVATKEKNSWGCEAVDEFHQVVREMNGPSAGLFLAL